MNKLLFAIAATLILSGCATPKMSDTTLADSPPTPDMVKIVITRDNSMIRFAWDAVVDVNNKEIAVLGRGDTVVYEVHAKKIDIDVHASSGGKDTYQIHVKPGNTYRFMIKPLSGGSKYSPTAMGVGIMMFEETTKPADAKQTPYFHIDEIQ